MEVKEFQVSIKSISYGCEKIVVSLDGFEIPFNASYIGDEPLSTLIKSILQLVEEPATNAIDIIWYDEPGTFKMELCKDEGDDIMTMKILSDKSRIGDHYEKIEYECEVSYEQYKQAIIKEALNVLREFGLSGFNESWCWGKDTFPLNSFLSILGCEPTYNKSRNCKESNIFEELDILRKALEETV